MKKIVLIVLLVMITSLVFSFGLEEKIRIIKDSPYVPTPINPKLHSQYIEKNYTKIINFDETVSYVAVIN